MEILAAGTPAPARPVFAATLPGFAQLERCKAGMIEGFAASGLMRVCVELQVLGACRPDCWAVCLRDS